MDFLHNYTRGERRPSDPVAYQWDLGNVLVAQIPETADDITVHYWQTPRGESQSYIPNSVTTANGVTTINANIPNVYFEKDSELRVYITAMSSAQEVTIFEGYVTIMFKPKPDDYVDYHPDNGAIPYVEAAKNYSLESEAWAAGTKSGTAVDSSAPQYHNNSKYYSELAGTAKSAAETAATSAGSSATDAAASASAAAAIVTVANDGMVLIDGDDDDQEYVVTFKVVNDHVVATLTAST